MRPRGGLRLGTEDLSRRATIAMSPCPPTPAR
jgi:hypothetical protein